MIWEIAAGEKHREPEESSYDMRLHKITVQYRRSKDVVLMHIYNVNNKCMHMQYEN